MICLMGRITLDGMEGICSRLVQLSPQRRKRINTEQKLHPKSTQVYWNITFRGRQIQGLDIREVSVSSEWAASI